MANIEFRTPSKEDITKPVHVSDLALAMGVDFSGEVQNKYGDMVPSAGLFWTNSVYTDINKNILGAVYNGVDEKEWSTPLHRNNIGVLPCIKNAAENGITTARLSDDVNDTREYLYDEKTQSFKMAPQTLATGNVQSEIWELLNGEFDKNFETLEKDYQKGMMSSELYEKKLADLKTKQESFSIVENGFPIVKRFGGKNDGKDDLKVLRTVSYNGETYAEYQIDSHNNPVKDGAKFSNGMVIDNHKTVFGETYWFKYEPILAEHKENGDVQLNTVLMPCPRISKDMQEDLNTTLSEGVKYKPIDYRYLNGNFAAHLGLNTDLIQKHEQKLQQAQEQSM